MNMKKQEKPMMTLKVTVTKIEWDFDGLKRSERPTLPNHAEFVIEVPNGSTTDVIEEEIGDHLSNAFGFTHNGYYYETEAVIK